jgi:hypothetical protein
VEGRGAPALRRCEEEGRDGSSYYDRGQSGEGKRCFFEKKKQKTFILLLLPEIDRANAAIRLGA